ncbi:MAG: DUF4924 family protein [Bacteroidaceae bacterium]|nr:DUF4924 family protein [Bacteroidaceae bacterium]
MYVAQKLREKNITGYVIYMYQVEDVIRAYSLDLDRIKEEYLPRFQYTPEQKEKVAEWYGNLISMMREENVQEKGHVQVLRNTMILLSDRHAELLHDPKQPFYSAAYYKALPYIVELRAHGSNREKDEIENCLDAVYGVTLLKMEGKPVSDDTLQAMQPITHLLELLSQLYREKD